MTTKALTIAQVLPVPKVKLEEQPPAGEPVAEPEAEEAPA